MATLTRPIAEAVDTESTVLPTKALADNERLFVNAYLKNGCNTMQAWIAAGGNPESAKSHSYEVRARPHVAAEIGRRLELADQKADVKVAEILAELKLLGFSDIADVLEDDGTGEPRMRKWGELPKHVTRAIKEFTVSETKAGRKTKFKMHDKQAPLELLARYLKMIGEKDGSGDTNNTLIVFQNAVSSADRFIEEALERGPSNRTQVVMPE